jgi:hypothetical protein
MKNIILIFTFLFSNAIISQINNCDQNTLSKEEFEKCTKDSVWSEDIPIKIEYITNLKTTILPKYRLIRRQFKTTNELDSKILKIKTLYDSVLVIKSTQFKKESDKNNFFVQPKSYLSTLLSLEIFNFYPDVYAILLNPIHLKLNPITSSNDLNDYNIMIDELINEIPETDQIELKKIIKNLNQDKKNYLNNYKIELFQGALNEEEKLKYDIVNFLIWKE